MQTSPISTICKPRRKLDSVITKAIKNLNFTLDIETTNTTPQRGMLLNRFEEPDSRIKKIRIKNVTHYDQDADECVILTKAQLKKMPGYTADTMTFKNTWINDETNETTDSTCMTFKKEGGFSCWEVIKNIKEFEKIDRPKSEWFGGVDCHHVFYEGIYFNPDGKTLGISWGS